MAKKIKFGKYLIETISVEDVNKTLKTEIDEKQLVLIALNNIGQQTQGQFKLPTTELIAVYDVLKTKGPTYNFEDAPFKTMKRVLDAYNFGTGETLVRAKEKLTSKIEEAEKEEKEIEKKEPKEESK